MVPSNNDGIDYWRGPTIIFVIDLSQTRFVLCRALLWAHRAHFSLMRPSAPASQADLGFRPRDSDRTDDPAPGEVC
jgi:hypothetical protein